MPTARPNPLAEFQAYSRRIPTQCVVARRVLELEPEERVKVEAALAAVDEVSVNAIKKWFREHHQIRVDDGSVKSHRLGECCCE